MQNHLAQQFLGKARGIKYNILSASENSCPFLLVKFRKVIGVKYERM